jgi:hypothetical protein
VRLVKRTYNAMSSFCIFETICFDDSTAGTWLKNGHLKPEFTLVKWRLRDPALINCRLRILVKWRLTDPETKDHIQE